MVYAVDPRPRETNCMNSDSQNADSAVPVVPAKKFERLIARTSLDLPTLTEYAAWCMDCRVRATGVGCGQRGYSFTSGGAGEIIVTLTETSEPITKESDLEQLVRLRLGLHLIGVPATVEGAWQSRFPSQESLDRYCPASEQKNDPSEQLHAHSFLTLNDLGEINATLTGETRAVNALMSDKKFLSVFPSLDKYMGLYGSFRHKSGNQVSVDWEDNSQIGATHKVDAPNPTYEIYRAWKNNFEKGPKSTHGEDRDEGMQRHRWDKWNLAKLLGTVPVKHQVDVFQYVSVCKFDVEEFHSTHGYYQIPENFELFFGNSVIFASRNLDWQIIEV